jgi:hypothetical protein
MTPQCIRFCISEITKIQNAAYSHHKTEKHLFQEIELTQDGIDIGVERLSNEAHA